MIVPGRYAARGPIAAVVERQQRLVGDRFDEAGAEERIGTRRAITFASGGMISWRVGGNRKDLEQRTRSGHQLHELAMFVTARRAHLGDHSGAADRRHAVAHRAARAVERRTEPVLGRFDLGEILEAQPELLEFAAGDSRQRISR